VAPQTFDGLPVSVRAFLRSGVPAVGPVRAAAVAAARVAAFRGSGSDHFAALDRSRVRRKEHTGTLGMRDRAALELEPDRIGVRPDDGDRD
jgi:hypothetical protein